MNPSRRRALVLAVSLSLLSFGTAVPAAATQWNDSSDTVVAHFNVDGRDYGPEDGAETVTEQYDADEVVDVEFSSDPEPGVFAPYARWGASYATSSEIAQFLYRGKARAAGNVYGGKRIVRVCFWYSRGGKAVSSKSCSSASSRSGKWRAGKEVSKTVKDSLNPKAPKTIFNIQTSRINPGVS